LLEWGSSRGQAEYVPLRLKAVQDDLDKTNGSQRDRSDPQIARKYRVKPPGDRKSPVTHSFQKKKTRKKLGVLSLAVP
jgi:hypothetical protein